MEQQFKTHEEIDKHYAKLGLDIPKLHKEFEETKIKIIQEHLMRKELLKKKMGKLRFWWWDSTTFSVGLGIEADKYYRKVKEMTQ